MSNESLSDVLRAIGPSYMNGPAYFGQGLSQTGQIHFFNSSSKLATIFQAGNATSEVTYTWPVADAAAANYGLVSNGAGTLSWLNLSSPSFTNITASGVVKIADGTISAPGLCFTSETNTGIYRSGSSTLLVTIGGANSLIFNGAAVISNLNLIPNADNTFKCGQSGSRWSEVWAANGTIQTSHSTTKRDITDIDPDAVDTPRAIKYKRFDSETEYVGFEADFLPPEAFAMREDGTRSAVDIYTASVIGVLCAKVKKLDQRVAQLEK